MARADRWALGSPRRVVTLAKKEALGPYDVPYLNRLSDALFVFGRWAAKMDGAKEPVWQPERT
jgi:cob(I)alamin adenosyltransferase